MTDNDSRLTVEFERDKADRVFPWKLTLRLDGRYMDTEVASTRRGAFRIARRMVRRQGPPVEKFTMTATELGR